MNVVKRIKNLTLSKETRLLRKYELIDDCDNLTDAGKEVIWEFLTEEYRAQLAEKATLLEAEDKKNK